jgi:hypothetical protein
MGKCRCDVPGRSGRHLLIYTQLRLANDGPNRRPGTQTPRFLNHTSLLIPRVRVFVCYTMRKKTGDRISYLICKTLTCEPFCRKLRRVSGRRVVVLWRR